MWRHKLLCLTFWYGKISVGLYYEIVIKNLKEIKEIYIEEIYTRIFI